MDAPRGGIALMRAAAQGRVGREALLDGFSQHMDLYLSCLACQTAWPSGVNYGALIETTKLASEIWRHNPDSRALMQALKARWNPRGLFNPDAFIV